MKYIILLFLIATCFIAQAQQVRVTYKHQLTYDYTVEYPLYLYIDTKNNSSIMLQDFKNKKDYDGSIAQTDAVATLDRTIDYDFLGFNLNTKEMIMYEDFARKVYKINDIFPEMKWQLTQESKEIQAIQVQKEMTTYRGVTWEVWFAPSLPYSFGPWKLIGLPGLVLEAKNAQGNITFQTEKIEYNVTCTNCELPKNIHKTISLKEYLIFQDEFYNIIDIDLPRGTTVTFDKLNILSKELEFEFPIKFTWEEEARK